MRNSFVKLFRNKDETCRLVFGIAVIILSLIVFREVISLNAVLFMTDNNLGFTAGAKDGLPDKFIGGAWTGGPLLGSFYLMTICLGHVLLWVLPLTVYNNWFHAMMLSLASLGFALFCVKRGCRVLPVLFGIMAAFWVGSGLTLTYSGHDGKYGILALAGVALWLIEMAASRKRIAWCIIAGGALGMMFVEQQDVALFIGLFLGAYAVYAILRENSWKWRALLGPLALMGTAALLVGGPNVLSGYMTQVKGVVAMSDESPRQKWDYCTSWSLPPEDVLEFIAPGFRGIRTGEPEGPYWGRMGRTPGWEQTRQGFQNFKLNSEYEGAIPIGFALFAVFLAIIGKNSEVRGQKSKVGNQAEVDGADSLVLSQRRGDVLFWGGATVVALMLAFGRFFPLYSIFYHLPGISSIRCPQKFMHVFQLGLGVLAAFGADALLRGVPQYFAGWSRRFAVVVLVLAGVLLLWAGTLAGSRESLTNGFVSEGWAGYAPVMAGNMVSGAAHAAIMTVIIGLGLLLLVAWRQRQKIWRYGVISALALVMVGDILLLAKDYIKVVSFQDVAGDNAVTVFLKDNLNQQRVYMMSQEGFYNNWLMVLFPYHHIETFNVSQMPRMPEDYDRWLKTVGRDPIRLWQLSAIGYVLAPDQAWQQIKKEPRFAEHFEDAGGFNVFASGTGVSVAAVPAGQKAGHKILRFKDGLPRLQIFHDWGVVSDKDIGEKLLDRAFNPLCKVWVAEDTAKALPSATTGMYKELKSKILESRLSATDAKVSAELTAPAVLTFVNKYSSDWRVEVDGKLAPLLRCNSLCLGVYVEPGRHEVRFFLRNQWVSFIVQLLGLFVVLVAVVFLRFERLFRKTRP